MSRREYVDPHRTRYDGHRLNPDAVRFYERNPGGHYRGGGGNAMGYRQADGSIHITNGGHRRQAAINRDRRLQVEVYDSHADMPRHETGQGCLGVVCLAAAGLGGLAAAAVEVVRVVAL